MNLVLFHCHLFQQQEKNGNRVFAKAEFTNLNSTKKVWILFVESEVEMDLRKRNRFSTKY